MQNKDLYSKKKKLCPMQKSSSGQTVKVLRSSCVGWCLIPSSDKGLLLKRFWRPMTYYYSLYCILIKSWWCIITSTSFTYHCVFYYCSIFTLYYRFLLTCSYISFWIHYYILLQHYNTIVTSFLHHYYNGKSCKKFHIMQWVCISYYIIMTYYYVIITKETFITHYYSFQTP